MYDRDMSTSLTTQTTLDQTALDEMLAAIRASVPGATRAHFQTSDQNLYGFVLEDVTMPDGSGLAAISPATYDRLLDASLDLLGDVDWNGVMGEDRSGSAVVDL